MSTSQTTGKSQHIINAAADYGAGLLKFVRGKVKSDADAEDIVQDVWCQLSSIDDGNNISHLRGWLYRVANNRIIDKARKKTEQFIDDLIYQDDEDIENIGFAEILLPDPDDPESVYLKELFWEALYDALDELPENQRNVFIQNELQDKTLQQIADESGEKLKTIISRKRYAVNHLRSRLQILYEEFLAY